MATFKEITDSFTKVLGMTSDMLHLTGILTKTGEGEQVKYALDPKAARVHAPRMTKTAEHESRWAAITGRLEPGYRQAILVHFMTPLHEQQQADLIQSAADASRIGDDGVEQVLEHLRHIADLQITQQQIDYADSLNWIKGNPNEYWIVRIENFAGQRFNNLRQLTAWLNNPGPTGFRNLATFAAAAIDVSGPVVANQLQTLTNMINAQTQVVRNRTSRRFFGLGRFMR